MFVSKISHELHTSGNHAFHDQKKVTITTVAQNKENQQNTKPKTFKEFIGKSQTKQNKPNRLNQEICDEETFQRNLTLMLKPWHD